MPSAYVEDTRKQSALAAASAGGQSHRDRVLVVVRLDLREDLVALGLVRNGHHHRAERGRRRLTTAAVDLLVGEPRLEVPLDLGGLVIDRLVEIDAVDDVQAALQIEPEVDLLREREPASGAAPRPRSWASGSRRTAGNGEQRPIVRHLRLRSMNHLERSQADPSDHSRAGRGFAGPCRPTCPRCTRAGSRTRTFSWSSSDQDVVVRDAGDLADHAAAGDDLVALSELGEHRLVLLLTLHLRADQDE